VLNKKDKLKKFSKIYKHMRLITGVYRYGWFASSRQKFTISDATSKEAIKVHMVYSTCSTAPAILFCLTRYLNISLDIYILYYKNSILNFKCYHLHTLNEKVHAYEKSSDVGFKLGTLWLTALVQNHPFKQALMCLYIHLVNKDLSFTSKTTRHKISQLATYTPSCYCVHKWI